MSDPLELSGLDVTDGIDLDGGHLSILVWITALEIDLRRVLQFWTR